MVNLPGPLRRPVPVQEATLRGLTVPIPFDGFPKIRDPAIESLLLFIATVEILAGGGKSPHQKRGFHKVAAVIKHSKHGHSLAGASVHVVRPNAMVAIGMFKEIDNLGKTLYALLACDETTIHSDRQGSDAKTARAGGYDAVVSGDAFAGHARVGIAALPVVSETGCLQHGKEFVVSEFVRGRTGGARQLRLAILTVRGSDLILCRHADLPQKIRVTVRIWKLNAYRLEGLAIE